MDILKRINAYRRNFESAAQIQGTSTSKYRNIIRPYLLTHNIPQEKDTGFASSSFSLPKAPITRIPTTRARLRNNSLVYTVTIKEGVVYNIVSYRHDILCYYNKAVEIPLNTLRGKRLFEGDLHQELPNQRICYSLI